MGTNCNRPRRVPSHSHHYRILDSAGWIKVRDIQVGYYATLSLMINPMSNVGQVVRKRYKNKRSAMAVSEARIIGELEHKNIIKLVGLHRSDEFVDLWLPLCNQDLYTDLEKAVEDPYFLHPSSINSRLKTLVSLLDAMEYMHSQGVVHRDIKPENVLMDDGQPLLIDFGFSEKVGKRKQVSGGLGSRVYAAPEILSNSESYDGRAADVYAMGATMWVVIFGHLPWDVEGEDKYYIGNIVLTQSLTKIVELIKIMTHSNPLLRPTAQEGLECLTMCSREYSFEGLPDDEV